VCCSSHWQSFSIAIAKKIAHEKKKENGSIHCHLLGEHPTIVKRKKDETQLPR
jgi:hypothetical protein